MYIPIELNERGKIEIDESVLTKLVDFSVKSIVEDNIHTETHMNIYHENNVFILIKLYFEDKINFDIDREYISNFINGIVDKTLSYKPKKISFAYLHNKK